VRDGWQSENSTQEHHEATVKFDIKIFVQKLVKNAPNTPF